MQPKAQVVKGIFMAKLSLVAAIPRTEAFDRFVAPAEPRSEFWRLLVALIFVVLFCFAMLSGLVAALPYVISEDAYAEVMADGGAGLTRLSASLVLASIAILPLALLIVVPVLHRRSFMSLFGPLGRLVQDFRTAVLIFSALALAVGIPLALYEGTTVHQPLGMVLAMLPVSILLILLQTGAEEVVFRGYIMQQLAARFQSPWIWMILPSVGFGLLHFDPTVPPVNAWAIVASIILTGILWADLVRITGNLGAAFGWHFANNFLVMTFVGYSDTMNGLGWRLLPFGYADSPAYYLALDPILAIVTWVVLRRVLGRRHGTYPEPLS